MAVAAQPGRRRRAVAARAGAPDARHDVRRRRRFGWSSAIWPTHRTDNWETLINNTAGLKNIVGQLEETPQQSGAARPTRRRAAPPTSSGACTRICGPSGSTSTTTARTCGDQGRDRGRRGAQQANDGPIYLDGARDVPIPPPAQEPTTKVLDPAPCGYLLTADQYAARVGSTPGDALQWTSDTAAERLEAHGVEVKKSAPGWFRCRSASRCARDPVHARPGPRIAGAHEGLPNLSMVEAVRLADRGPTVVDRLGIRPGCRTASTTRAARSTT